MGNKPANPHYLARLRDNLATFSPDDLENLGLDLGISDRLPRNASSRELALTIVKQCGSLGKLDDLATLASQGREHLGWQPPDDRGLDRVQKKYAKAGIIAVIVMVMFLLALNMATRPSGPTIHTVPTPTALLYQVKVIAGDDGGSIPEARVRIELPGAAPLSQFTDSDGMALFRIMSSLAGQTARLIVDAERYEQNVQTIRLEKDAPTKRVQLNSKP